MNQQQTQEQDQVYGIVKTRDIFHAAYLITQGMTLKTILPDTTSNRSKAIFILEGEGISFFEERYKSGRVEVNVFALKDSVQRVKDVMFDYLRTRGLS
ncbi:MAG: hypothetical protein KAR07_03810 [Spirochaetes bacterium]|nr:hypothetical protein [Candidatus Omnitrophota bacterium]MCK5267269.1 hypothetical protein [Spirochaetota bacterium]